MHPVFADFSVRTPRTGNARVESERASFRRDHLALDAGGTVAVRFDVPPEGVTDELTVKIRALVSKLGPRPGHAPLEVRVNATTLLSDYRVPGGGDIPQEIVLAVPAELLRPGQPNTLVLRSAGDARSHLWLYRVLIEPVGDRDGAERALLADGFATSLLSYRTSRRAAGADDGWEDGPLWRLHIDSGERGLPARLDWRARSGAEASVCFAQELTTCYGHLRDPGGRWYEVRGELADRRPFPAAPGARPGDGFTRTFATEAGWGGRWHPGGPLTLHLSTGDGPYDRIGWSDQRGCGASIGLAPDGDSFLGWSQRATEGPVGYRGTAVVPEPAVPADPTGPTGLAEDLDELGQALTGLADTAARQLTSWWRQGR